MKISALKTTFVAALLIVSAASRVRATGDPQTPSAPAAPQAAPAPPAATAPPAPPTKKTRRIVVSSPEKEVVVDGDRVYIWGDDDEPGMIADIEGLDDEGLPPMARMHGHAGGGFIGIRPIEMTPELRQHFGAPKDAGILVGSVEADGPAAKGGLQVGDIVTAIDGDRVDSTGELVRMVRHKKGGETIKVEVFRNRAAKSVTITVAERKARQIQVGEFRNQFPHGGWRWKMPRPGHPAIAPLPPDVPQLEERLDELEKRLSELEGRAPGK